MIVTVTGHREVDNSKVYKTYYDRLRDIRPDMLIQGLASGTDLLAAVAAIDLSIPVFSVKPWTTHRARVADRNTYDWVLTNSWDVYVTTEAETFPGNWVYPIRNKFMIDEGDEVWSWWDGSEKGGTWDAIKYARNQGKRIVNLYET